MTNNNENTTDSFRTNHRRTSLPQENRIVPGLVFEVTGVGDACWDQGQKIELRWDKLASLLDSKHKPILFSQLGDIERSLSDKKRDKGVGGYCDAGITQSFETNDPISITKRSWNSWRRRMSTHCKIT